MKPARDLQQHALPAGQPLGGLVRETAEAGLVEQVARFRVALRQAAAAREMRHEQVLGEAHVAEDARHLEGAHEAAGRDCVRREARDGVPIERDRAGIRPLHARDQVHQRGLPGAVRPDDAADLTRRHVEIDRVGGGEPAEALDEAARGQERRGIAHASRIRSPNRPLGFTRSTASSSTNP